MSAQSVAEIRASSQSPRVRAVHRRKFSHRNTESHCKEPAMNSRRPQQAVSFALSLILTLAIFSGVASLSAPEHAGQLLVQASTSAAHG
jgi:hypothetical protein